MPIMPAMPSAPATPIAPTGHVPHFRTQQPCFSHIVSGAFTVSNLHISPPPKENLRFGICQLLRRTTIPRFRRGSPASRRHPRPLRFGTPSGSTHSNGEGVWYSPWSRRTNLTDRPQADSLFLRGCRRSSQARKAIRSTRGRKSTLRPAPAIAAPFCSGG